MKMIYFLLCVFVGIAVSSAKQSAPPRTRIRQGEVIGTDYFTYSGRKVAAFYGLPFAAPPVGDLRFEPPQPPRSWDKPLVATNKSDWCSQVLLAGPVVNIGNEDCLYLNVYTPQVPKDGKCEKYYNVLLYFHPSGYVISSGSNVEPYYMMDKHDLVFVPMNYRLDILGNFFTGDEVGLGNQFLKDQLFSMKWVRDNIRSFCGDPDKVTLAGASAGAISVGLHMINPKSKGLFHNAILASGNAFFYQLFNRNDINYTRIVANQMNCPTTDSKSMIKCLKHKPSEDLFSYSLQFRPFFLLPIATWTPQIEPCYEGAMLTKTPVQALEDGDLYDVPMLVNNNEFEGLLFAYLLAVPGISETLDLTYKTNLKYIFDFFRCTPPHLFEDVSEKIKKEYFGDGLITGNEYLFKRLLTDGFFGVTTYNSSVKYAHHKRSPVYNFFSTYRGQISTSVLTSITQTNKNYGAAHFDADMYAIFNGLVDKKFRRNQNDTAMIEFMTELYYSFMVNGKPSVADEVGWKPQPREGDAFRYLHFDNPGRMRQVDDDNFANQKFWNSLPIDPYRNNRDDYCKPNSRMH